MKFDKERLKGLPIIQVGQKLGLPVSENKKVIACFLHQDKTPSLSFNVRGNYAKCFGCDSKPMDTIELVSQYLKVDFIEACNWLCHAFGIPIDAPAPSGSHHRTARPRRAHPTDPPRGVYTDVYDTISAEFGLTPRGMDYLASRGLSTETVYRFRIISIDDPPQLQECLNDYYPRDTLKAAGFYNDKNRFMFFKPGILIPFIEHEKIIYWQLRTYETDKRYKYLNLSGIPRPIWNIDSIRDLKFGSNVAVFEGVFDALSSYEFFPDLAAVSIQGQSHPQRLASHFINYRILFGGDNDDTGRRLMGELNTEIRKRGGEIFPYPLRYGTKDLNEYLQKERAING